MMLKSQGSNTESKFSVETNTGIRLEPQVSIPKSPEIPISDWISLSTLLTMGWIIREIRLLILAVK
jgi:hypothetical protein